MKYTRDNFYPIVAMLYFILQYGRSKHSKYVSKSSFKPLSDPENELILIK